MTLTLDFQGQIFNSHILGMEWKRCELYTMLNAQWACTWTRVHGKNIGQVMSHTYHNKIACLYLVIQWLHMALRISVNTGTGPLATKG